MSWIPKTVCGALFIAFLGCFLTCLAMVRPQIAHAVAGVNPQISFQGKVVKSDGTNIADGTYNMEFKIYQDGTSTSGGTLKWTEDRLVSASTAVTITSGTFQVNLGSIASLSSVDFNQNTLWLSMQVGSTTSCTVTTTFQSNCAGDGEMSPYIRLTATPYALNADRLDGIDGASLVQLTPSSQQTGSINISGSLTSGATIQGAAIVSTSTLTGTGLNATAAGGVLTTNLGTLQRTASGVTVVDLNDTAATTLVVKNAGTGSIANLNIFNGSLTTGSSPVTRIDSSGNVTALGITATGNTLLQPTAASATAFVVQASGPLAILTADTSNKQVIIGSATSDATQINLQVDSSNVFTEAATCSTTVNQGSLYYSTATGSMRGCINGNWEDMVSTGGLGLLAYGIVPDSANSGNIGELSGIAQTNSPCKVYWASATSVTVAPCYAYSGGRKVQVASATLSTASIAANAYVNVCLTGTGNQPALVGTGNATETSATLPTWSPNNPVSCIATLQMSATVGTITGGKIYDIRTFTTTQKSFATLNTAMALGTATVQSATANILGAPGAAAASFTRGILVGYSGAISATTANAIIATAGPQWVKATGTSTVAQYAQIGATTGYASSVSTLPTGGYATLGSDTRTIDTTCTSNATCQYSQFLNPLALR